MIDGRGRPPRLTEKDIPRVKELVATMDHPSRRRVAMALEMSHETFRNFLRRYQLDLFPHQCQLPTRANGLTGQLFEAAARQGISMTYISRRLPAHQATVLRWRRGEQAMTLFTAQCIANIVGLELTLIPKDAK